MMLINIMLHGCDVVFFLLPSVDGPYNSNLSHTTGSSQSNKTTPCSMSIEADYTMVDSDASSSPLAFTALPGEKAYTMALLRSLKHGGVKFLRYLTIDVNNNIRCKSVPVDRLMEAGSLDHQVSVANVCYAGLASYADVMVDGTGMDATEVLVIKPDLNSLRILPYNNKTAVVMGTLHNQFTGELSPLDGRGQLQKLIEKAKSEKSLAFSVGAEIEFCLLDRAGQPVDHSIFANSTTLNEQEDFISEVYDFLKDQEVDVELIHAESGPGQLEVVLKYQHNPVQLVDNVLLAQETIRAVAHRHGLRVLFLPKYSASQAGNGLHVHMSVRDCATNKNLLCKGSSCAGFSDVGERFLEGILQHLPGILGMTLPSVNSYRRVGKGCWTGSVVGWALEDKESGLRVCSDLATQEWQHVECKLVDGSCNLYLALIALLASGLEGVSNSSDSFTLRPPITQEVKSNLAPLPTQLTKSLDALESDKFLQELFGAPFMKAYLALRRHEATRGESMTLEDEVAEALK